MAGPRLADNGLLLLPTRPEGARAERKGAGELRGGGGAVKQ